MGLPVDAVMAMVLPMTTFWIQCLIYHAFDEFRLFQKYRFMAEEVYQKNKATKSEVVKSVLIQQCIALVIGCIALIWEPENTTMDDPLGFTSTLLSLLIERNSYAQQSPLLAKLIHTSVLILRLGLGMIVYDTWQFWIHYGLHMVPWLYRNIHITHHRLYAPYSFAAIYVHPFEAFLLDMLGPLLTYTLIGLTPRERTVLFVLATIKTVDDHSGYMFPWDPVILLGRLTGSDIVYHTIHHQPWGIKTNYALFFTFWDRWMGTIYKGPKRLDTVKEREKSRQLEAMTENETLRHEEETLLKSSIEEVPDSSRNGSGSGTAYKSQLSEVSTSGVHRLADGNPRVRFLTTT